MSSLASPHGALSRGARDARPVLPGHARIHNLALVQRELFHAGAMSRADLARATGLTRVTTSALVGELVDRGTVVERGLRAPSGPGKPGVLVDLDREGLQVISLDLSGVDAYRGALMDLTGKVLAREEEPRRSGESSRQAQEAVLALARRLRGRADRRVLGVGVGSPGVISDEGVVLAAPNIGWEGVPLRDLLQRDLEDPVVVRNDANAAALAEHTLGDADPDLFLVRVGRGVGGALMVRGELVVGRYNAAGEIGHVPVGEGGGPPCACGKRGCLEAWISVPSLTRLLHEADRDGGSAEDVLSEAGTRLGIMLAPIVGALNLSDVVLAGPADLLGGRFLDAAQEALRSHILGRFHTQVRIRLPEHSDDIVLRGGLVMVLESELGIS
ncbi:ROK family transcriptional regulator [Nesterenkonia xinjiangensis]|uniref:Putative NBD/HSP70 family sugar kinase n=1 Tax=Nesterenkonia xinjiangensis TaxID=225327 RepID=A0A7Z0GLE8_9MICC|nr:ROK family transcriptional regulator [Nesterenkonia xinjiangensis]NYJ78117.1 putative NBD/HSP70 family sugar kinase [Nesterenkonia xinjiangensis]